MRLSITAYKGGDLLGSGSYNQERIPRVMIGSGEGAHLRVEEPEIAGQHLELYLVDGVPHARPLDAEVWLNGEPLEGEAKLGKEDRVRIGEDVEFTAEVMQRHKKPGRSKKEEPPSKSHSVFSPKGGRISFNKFVDVAGKTDQEERPVPKLKKKKDPDEADVKPAKDSEEKTSSLPPFLRLTGFDVVKVLVILVMVIVLFGMIIIPTVQKLLVS